MIYDVLSWGERQQVYGGEVLTVWEEEQDTMGDQFEPPLSPEDRANRNRDDVQVR